MMWRYKTAMIITLVFTAISIISDIRGALGIFSHTTVYWLLSLANMIIGILYFQNFIVILKKAHEEPWLTVPFYGLMACVILYFGSDIISSTITSLHMRKFYFIVSAPGILVQLFLLVSVFNIQNPIVSIYYKIYAFANVSVMLLSVFMPVIIAVVFLRDYFVFSQYSRYMIKTLNYIPTFIALALQYKLYLIHDVFGPGDEVILNKEVDNIPSGSIGSVLQKHSAYRYEIEFKEKETSRIIPVSVDDMSKYDRIVYRRPDFIVD